MTAPSPRSASPAASSARRRIVLYHPRLVDEHAGRRASAHLLPLPLLAVAGLPQREGCEVVLVDGNLHSPAEARARVLEACEGALVYGTTGILGNQVSDGLACTRAVKARYPELPAVVGGWFATAVPELELETGLYDAVVLGQGELTFAELVRALAEGRALDELAGLALPRGGAVVRTDPRRVAALGELPPMPWELVDWEAYRALQLRDDQRDSVEAIPAPPGFEDGRPFTAISYHGSFGCPLPCAFCCSPETTGRRWKALSGERMAEEIAALQARWGFDVVHFHDANFGVAEKRAREFAEALLARGTRVHWYAYMQAESVLRYAPETLDLMARSGFYLAVIGAESGADETMKAVGKPTRGDENLRATRELDRRGISVQASYLIGFPDEPEEAMLATLAQAREVALACPRSAPMVWRYQPIPGAAYFERSRELGYEPPRTLDEWGRFFDYRREELWPGAITPRVRRMHKLYNHFAHLANGLARGRVGFWEQRARRRMADAPDFARGWPLGTLEAKAFDLAWRVERRLRPRSLEYRPGWRAGASRGQQAAPPVPEAVERGAHVEAR